MRRGARPLPTGARFLIKEPLGTVIWGERVLLERISNVAARPVLEIVTVTVTDTCPTVA